MGIREGELPVQNHTEHEVVLTGHPFNIIPSHHPITIIHEGLMDFIAGILGAPCKSHLLGMHAPSCLLPVAIGVTGQSVPFSILYGPGIYWVDRPMCPRCL